MDPRRLLMPASKSASVVTGCPSAFNLWWMRDFTSQRLTAVGRLRPEAFCICSNVRIIVHPYSAGTSLARAERAVKKRSWSNPVGCADLVVKISHSNNGMNCPYSLSPDFIFDSLTQVSLRASLSNDQMCYVHCLRCVTTDLQHEAQTTHCRVTVRRHILLTRSYRLAEWVQN